MQLVMTAPRRFVPVSVALVRSAKLRSASSKLAPKRSQPLRSTFDLSEALHLLFPRELRFFEHL